MKKELVKAFVQECIDAQDYEAKFKANHIEFENYFKYSGRIEESKILISHWKYDNNHKCNDLHEKFIKIKQYEKNKKNTGKLSKEGDTYYWEETKNGIWSD